ncbi:hypothetical protein AA21291_1655 [Swaminathania salitolerans LMG 21291]|nr:hypothetical protein AA21291_1655 [Swaminathania salitolerans LMG 21291]
MIDDRVNQRVPGGRLVMARSRMTVARGMMGMMRHVMGYRRRGKRIQSQLGCLEIGNLSRARTLRTEEKAC